MPFLVGGIIGNSESELLSNLDDKPSNVFFKPYLSGERTPHNNPHLRGSFSNLEHATSKQDMTKAILEGVAFAFREGKEAMGGNFTQADVIGGGSRSPLWIAILANVLNIPLHTLENGEMGGAFGAARLAIIAANKGSIEEVCFKPKRLKTYMPNPSSVLNYNEQFQKWKNPKQF